MVHCFSSFLPQKSKLPFNRNIYKKLWNFKKGRQKLKKYKYEIFINLQGLSWDFARPFFLKLRQLGVAFSGISIFIKIGLRFDVWEDKLLPLEIFSSSSSFAKPMLWVETTSTSLLKEWLSTSSPFSNKFFFNFLQVSSRFLLLLSNSPFFLLMTRLSWDIFFMYSVINLDSFWEDSRVEHILLYRFSSSAAFRAISLNFSWAMTLFSMSVVINSKTLSIWRFNWSITASKYEFPSGRRASEVGNPEEESYLIFFSASANKVLIEVFSLSAFSPNLGVVIN